MSNQQVPDNAQNVVREPYVTPQLIAYGLVRDLTAGGSGTVVETGTGMNHARVRP